MVLYNTRVKDIHQNSLISHFMAENHGDGVVSKATAGMHGNGRRFIDDDEVFVLMDDRQRRRSHRNLVTMNL